MLRKKILNTIFNISRKGPILGRDAESVLARLMLSRKDFEVEESYKEDLFLFLRNALQGKKIIIAEPLIYILKARSSNPLFFEKQVIRLIRILKKLKSKKFKELAYAKLISVFVYLYKRGSIPDLSKIDMKKLVIMLSDPNKDVQDIIASLKDEYSEKKIKDSNPFDSELHFDNEGTALRHMDRQRVKNWKRLIELWKKENPGKTIPFESIIREFPTKEGRSIVISKKEGFTLDSLINPRNAVEYIFAQSVIRRGLQKIIEDISEAYGFMKKHGFIHGHPHYKNWIIYYDGENFRARLIDFDYLIHLEDVNEDRHLEDERTINILKNRDEAYTKHILRLLINWQERLN